MCDRVNTRSMRGIALAAAVVMLACSLNCQTQVTPPDDTTNIPDDTTNPPGRVENETISFSGRIQPIFTPTCTVCHSPGGVADLSGIALQLTEDVAYDLLVNQASVQDESFTLVVPGDSASSLLFLKINSNSPPIGDRMPLFSSVLSADEIALIRDWIDQGAMDN